MKSCFSAVLLLIVICSAVFGAPQYYGGYNGGPMGGMMNGAYQGAQQGAAMGSMLGGASGLMSSFGR
ncbi:hypothetical protein DdX_13012 [Ditylenchus destructor]|uniref:Uncharacterized protein n=1 Tax=Ditylenchus destructor TaxID=166010 RepID=A0AAD4MWX7_9BILA|nr:hypothetical protein DdX_13012 [Ditylenchus destructor]